LYETAPTDLEELIRPAGYYRVKTRRLRNLLAWLHERYAGSLERMFASRLDTLREELLAVSGIGPETADSILLYAGGMPTFVVDAYTHRVLARHGWIDAEADYYRIQELFAASLPQDAALFNEYHALLVRVGKEHCKPTPVCEGCPLCELLPERGPLGRE
jgi:endonuclease-3 related protein